MKSKDHKEGDCELLVEYQGAWITTSAYNAIIAALEATEVTESERSLTIYYY